MPAVTAQQYWQRWSDGMNAAGDKMRAGINRVQITPAAAAIAAQSKMRANWLQAVDSGKWANNLGAMTLAIWQRAMIDKGIPRIADGVRGSQTRVTNFANALLAFETNLQNQVRAMPNITPQDREARVLAWMRGMRTFDYQRNAQ